MLRNIGQLEQGMELLQQQQQICQQLGDRDGLAICLANQSLIREQWGELPNAIELCQQAIELRQACGIPTDDWQQRLADYQRQLAQSE